MAQGAVAPVSPVGEETTPVERERLFDCDYFRLWRLRGQSPFAVGSAGAPRVLVCIAGTGRLEHGGDTYAAGKGDVLLLPAALGACVFQPSGPVILLEAALPQ
jgi:mannose-6-phosphate isomerase